MSKNIPTVSSKGWVNTVEEKADLALSYFIASEYSQSVVHYGQIHSLAHHLKQYAGNIQQLETAINASLEKILRAYFTSDITTTVSVRPTQSDDRSLTIRLTCIIREQGREYPIGRVVNTVNSRITQYNSIIAG